MQNQLIYKKISEVMGKVGAVAKSRKNQQQGYSFRGIDDMYNALNSHLSEVGVFATTEILDRQREEKVSKGGSILFYTVLRVKFTFYAEDGSNVSSIMEGEAMDSGDKSTNKAMSTAYKYALMQIFCIPTEEEKDTEEQTHEVKPPIKEEKLDPTPEQIKAIEWHIKHSGKVAPDKQKDSLEMLHTKMSRAFADNLIKTKGIKIPAPEEPIVQKEPDSNLKSGEDIEETFKEFLEKEPELVEGDPNLASKVQEVTPSDTAKKELESIERRIEDTLDIQSSYKRKTKEWEMMQEKIEGLKKQKEGLLALFPKLQNNE